MNFGHDDASPAFPVGPDLDYGSAMTHVFATCRRAALPGALVFAMGLSMGACSNMRDALGVTKSSPDEFNVVTRAPLQLPPTLDVLPDPQPGLQRPEELNPQEQAMAVLLGGNAATTTRSSTAETMLMAQAETDANEPDIRETIDIEHDQIANEHGFFDAVQFWRDKPDDTEVVVDAAREKQRLQNNAALGLQASAGDFEAVVIVPKEKGLLEDIF